MRFGKLELNPATNPGVLDTGTWDFPAARVQLRAVSLDWRATAALLRKHYRPPATAGIKVWRSSASLTPTAVWALADLPDGQSVLLCLGGEASDAVPGPPLDQWHTSDGFSLRIFPSSAAVLDSYGRSLKPAKAPRALGCLPRLGIGTRMTTQVWPGIFDAMSRRHIAANSIQNSVRELSLLDDLLAALPAEKNYSTGIGIIEAGWTGSTYEGLWTAGVLAALKSDHELCYGADADHVQVKRGPGGVEHARRLLRAARYYSFYTLDMADVLEYSALNLPDDASVACLERKIPDVEARRSLIEHQTRPRIIAGRCYQLDRCSLGRLVGKYWDALDVIADLANYISSLKSGVPFDLELTIDEHPPEVSAFECLTTDEEVLFLALEIKRRALPITHLAPNFGQEKGTDYRCPGGLSGLETRARAQFEIAAEFGLMLDVHSGDDLGREARQVFGRASGGRIHFKVSPRLQLIYAETLQAFHPALFERWWADAVAYARREAGSGSTVAQECLAELEGLEGTKPSARRKVFQSYSFPFVGRRDAEGQFLNRAEFYGLSDPFIRSYQERVSDWLCDLADDVCLKAQLSDYAPLPGQFQP